MNLRTILDRLIHCITFLAVAFAMAAPSEAYELWLGCTKIPQTAVTRPETWENSRSGITGTNLNLRGFVKANLNNPIVQGEKNLTKKDWRKFFALMRPEARRGMDPIARSAIKNKDAPDRPSIEKKLVSIFDKKPIEGYEVGSLLPYSSRLGENEKYDPVNFTTNELATIRKWLDTYEEGKFKDVKIVDNIRLFNKKRFLQELSTRGELVDMYLFEAAPDKFYEDRGNRLEMLKMFVTDARLKDKEIIFQIPISRWEHKHEKGANNYQMLRHFIVWLGDNYGHDFLQGDRVKLLITTYNPTIPFYPELSPDKREYQNTITGIILSLIEQEPLFTGLERNSDGTQRKPTKADAYSYTRAAKTNESGDSRNDRKP